MSEKFSRNDPRNFKKADSKYLRVGGSHDWVPVALLRDVGGRAVSLGGIGGGPHEGVRVTANDQAQTWCAKGRKF